MPVDLDNSEMIEAALDIVYRCSQFKQYSELFRGAQTQWDKLHKSFTECQDLNNVLNSELKIPQTMDFLAPFVRRISLVDETQVFRWLVRRALQQNSVAGVFKKFKIGSTNLNAIEILSKISSDWTMFQNLEIVSSDSKISQKLRLFDEQGLKSLENEDLGCKYVVEIQNEVNERDVFRLILGMPESAEASVEHDEASLTAATKFFSQYEAEVKQKFDLFSNMNEEERLASVCDFLQILKTLVQDEPQVKIYMHDDPSKTSIFEVFSAGSVIKERIMSYYYEHLRISCDLCCNSKHKLKMNEDFFRSIIQYLIKCRLIKFEYKTANKKENSTAPIAGGEANTTVSLGFLLISTINTLKSAVASLQSPKERSICMEILEMMGSKVGQLQLYGLCFDSRLMNLAILSKYESKLKEIFNHYTSNDQFKHYGVINTFMEIQQFYRLVDDIGIQALLPKFTHLNFMVLFLQNIQPEMSHLHNRDFLKLMELLIGKIKERHKGRLFTDILKELIHNFDNRKGPVLEEIAAPKLSEVKGSVSLAKIHNSSKTHRNRSLEIPKLALPDNTNRKSK